MIVGYFAFKIIPIKKTLMMFWLLAPMTIQQCSSINYDSVLIPVCFLLIAYILYLRLSTKEIGFKNIAFVALLVLTIALIKPPYLFIGLMVFIIPLNRYKLDIGKNIHLHDLIARYRWIITILLVSLLFVGIYFVRDFSYVKFIRVCLMHPLKVLSMFGNSFAELDHYYVYSTVGGFSWLEVTVSVPFEILFFVMLTYLFMKDGDDNDNIIDANKLRKSNRVLMISIVVLVVWLIFVSMLSWSFYVYGFDYSESIRMYSSYLNKLTRFDGIQGRYFIPVIPLLLIALKSRGKQINKDSYILIMIYYGISLFYLSNLLYDRFWG